MSPGRHNSHINTFFNWHTKILFLGIVLLVVPISLHPSNTSGFATLSPNKLLTRAVKAFSPASVAFYSSKAVRNMTKPTPVFFLSHGGPNIMEETSHPAYAELQRIGKEITQTVKPKAVVVFSAHWQGGSNLIEVNTATSQGLIYDFYGFPAHYYDFKYPNEGSPELAEKVIALLGQAGIEAEGTRRGLDHGVWASFMVAFDPSSNPLNVPIVQVSLFDTEDPDQHYALGRAIASLRQEGIQIIVSGMAVHNLRDLWAARSRPGPMPYAVSFDEALKQAVEAPVESRQKSMAALMERSDARKAHPTFDHLLPIYVGAGAAAEDRGKQIWTLPEGSMSWAQFQFGEFRDGEH